MRDLYFYPLAFVIVMVIVATAVLPGLNRAAENQQNILTKGFDLRGADLGKLTTAPTLFAEFSTNPEGEITHARVYGNMPRDMAPASAGIFGTLSTGYLRAFSGQTLEISVRARKTANSKIDNFELGFFTPGGASSGWNSYALTSEYKDFSFNYTAPDKLAENPVSYVGVWPGDKGDSQPMDIQSISVKIVQP